MRLFLSLLLVYALVGLPALAQQRNAEYWHVSDVKDPGTGKFSYCAVESGFDNGLYLAFARNRELNTNIIVSFPDHRLEAHSKYRMLVGIDTFPVRDVVGFSADGSTLVVPLQHDRKILEWLNKGKLLELKGPQDAVRFSLDGASAALRQLQACVETGLKTETQQSGGAPAARPQVAEGPLASATVPGGDDMVEPLPLPSQPAGSAPAAGRVPGAEEAESAPPEPTELRKPAAPEPPASAAALEGMATPARPSTAATPVSSGDARSGPSANRPPAASPSELVAQADTAPPPAAIGQPDAGQTSTATPPAQVSSGNLPGRVPVTHTDALPPSGADDVRPGHIPVRHTDALAPEAPQTVPPGHVPVRRTDAATEVAPPSGRLAAPRGTVQVSAAQAQTAAAQPSAPSDTDKQAAADALAALRARLQAKLDAEAKVKADAEAKAAAQAKADADEKAARQARDEADAKAGAQAKADADAKAQAQAKADADAKAAAEAKADANSRAAAQARADADAKAAAQARIEADARAVAQAKADADAKAAAQAKADAEARAAAQAKAEADARAAAQAKQDAADRAAQQAKLYAEVKAAEQKRLDAAAKAESDAKAAQEAKQVAQAKADAAARAVQAQARADARAAAQAKAEADARAAAQARVDADARVAAQAKADADARATAQAKADIAAQAAAQARIDEEAKAVAQAKAAADARAAPAKADMDARNAAQAGLATPPRAPAATGQMAMVLDQPVTSSPATASFQPLPSPPPARLPAAATSSAATITIPFRPGATTMPVRGEAVLASSASPLPTEPAPRVQVAELDQPSQSTQPQPKISGASIPLGTQFTIAEQGRAAAVPLGSLLQQAGVAVAASPGRASSSYSWEKGSIMGSAAETRSAKPFVDAMLDDLDRREKNCKGQFSSSIGAPTESGGVTYSEVATGCGAGQGTAGVILYYQRGNRFGAIAQETSSPSREAATKFRDQIEGELQSSGASP